MLSNNYARTLSSWKGVSGGSWIYRDDLSKSQTIWGTTTAYSIVWDGSKFCAVGDLGKVATSTDGVIWTYQTGLSSTAWGTIIANSIAWNGSKFCVVGNSGKVATSV